MLATLEHHDIQVDVRQVDIWGSVVEMLLTEADRDGAKLIVMGALEPSKFSHDLFGGVMTDMIRDACAPVFVAH